MNAAANHRSTAPPAHRARTATSVGLRATAIAGDRDPAGGAMIATANHRSAALPAHRARTVTFPAQRATAAGGDRDRQEAP